MLFFGQEVILFSDQKINDSEIIDGGSKDSKWYWVNNYNEFQKLNNNYESKEHCLKIHVKYLKIPYRININGKDIKQVYFLSMKLSGPCQ